MNEEPRNINKSDEDVNVLEQSQNKCKPMWFKVLMIIAPIVWMLYLPNVTADSFEKAHASKIALWLVNSLIIIFGIYAMLVNSVYLDNERRGWSYAKVVTEYISYLYPISICIGIGCLLSVFG